MYTLILCRNRRVGTKVMYNDVPAYMLPRASNCNTKRIHVPSSELCNTYEWRVATNEYEIGGAAVDRIIVVGDIVESDVFFQEARERMWLSNHKIVEHIWLDS